MEQGFVTLQAPPGNVPTDVWLSTGRKVSPDSRGCIFVHRGEDGPLLNAGWTIVPPASVRWKPLT
jgi:hypothetical protein